LVHRKSSYVTTLKSFSQRTSNSECNNNQNPFGFHLSDGSIFSYIDGDEYVDVFGAYDWNLIPGTTVDYGATPLNCNQTQYYGNTSFVGSVTPQGPDGYSTQGGMAVMQYLNPLTGSLRWEKTFYFFPGLYAVQIGPIYSQDTSPIITTLDQSNLKGDVYINGNLSSIMDTSFATTNTSILNLWHNHILYTLVNPNASTTFKVNTNSHVSNDWSAIGISQGKVNQRIFTATIEHPQAPLLASADQKIVPLTYVAQLNTETKQQESFDDLIQFVYQEDSNYGRVRGAYYVPDGTIALAFWTAGNYTSPWGISVATDKPILTYFTTYSSGDSSSDSSYTLTVSDPTQLLTNVTITVTQDGSDPQVYNVSLPQSPNAGMSITVNI
jgi:hypothetical protein